MCNKHYTTSVKTRFTFVFYTDSYIRGINHIFSSTLESGNQIYLQENSARHG